MKLSPVQIEILKTLSLGKFKKIALFPRRQRIPKMAIVLYNLSRKFLNNPKGL